MKEFFFGWRRKLGFATLLLSSTLMMGWMRSYITEDEVIFRSKAAAYFITSGNESVELEINTKAAVIENSLGLFPTRWRTWKGELIAPTSPDYEPEDGFEGLYIVCRWRFWGFDIGIAVDHLTPMQIFCCKFSYALVVAPLTLISAYLLIRPPPNPSAKYMAASDSTCGQK